MFNKLRTTLNYIHKKIVNHIFFLAELMFSQLFIKSHNLQFSKKNIINYDTP